MAERWLDKPRLRRTIPPITVESNDSDSLSQEEQEASKRDSRLRILD